MPETQNEQQAPPSKEELINFFKEQIEVKKVQFELHDLNAKIALARAEELKAMAFIAQMTSPQEKENGIPHTLTKEDLDTNPDLVEAGLKEGDEIIIPNGVTLEEPKPSSKKLKKV